jgi:hypothetical protein
VGGGYLNDYEGRCNDGKEDIEAQQKQEGSYDISLLHCGMIHCRTLDITLQLKGMWQYYIRAKFRNVTKNVI